MVLITIPFNTAEDPNPTWTKSEHKETELGLKLFCDNKKSKWDPVGGGG